MPQLDLSTYALQLLWLALSFAALYLLVRYLFVPKIESKIAARSAIMEKNIALAELMLKETEGIQYKTDRLLQSAREEAKVILAKSDNDIKTFVDAQNKETERKCTELYKEGEKEAAQFQQEIIQQIPEIIEQLKVEVIEKLIHQPKVRKL